MYGNRGLIAVGLALLLVTAGCAELITGSGPISFTADEASISDAALAETGYEESNVQKMEFNETVEFDNNSRQIHVVSHMAAYTTQKEVGDNGNASVQGGSVMVLSTPQGKFAGAALNPMANLGTRDLIQRVLQQAESRSGADVSELEEVGTEEVEILGEDREVVIYETTGEQDGEEVTMHLYVAKIKHGDDVLLVVGMHPEQIDEKSNILTLMQGVEHESSDD